MGDGGDIGAEGGDDGFRDGMGCTDATRFSPPGRLCCTDNVTSDTGVVRIGTETDVRSDVECDVNVDMIEEAECDVKADVWSADKEAVGEETVVIVADFSLKSGIVRWTGTCTDINCGDGGDDVGDAGATYATDGDGGETKVSSIVNALSTTSLLVAPTGDTRAIFSGSYSSSSSVSETCSSSRLFCESATCISSCTSCTKCVEGGRCEKCAGALPLSAPVSGMCITGIAPQCFAHEAGMCRA